MLWVWWFIGNRCVKLPFPDTLKTLFMCMFCVSERVMPHMYACPQGPEKSIRSSGAGVTGSHVLPDGAL